MLITRESAWLHYRVLLRVLLLAATAGYPPLTWSVDSEFCVFYQILIAVLCFLFLLLGYCYHHQQYYYYHYYYY